MTTQNVLTISESDLTDAYTDRVFFDWVIDFNSDKSIYILGDAVLMLSSLFYRTGRTYIRYAQYRDNKNHV